MVKAPPIERWLAALQSALKRAVPGHFTWELRATPAPVFAPTGMHRQFGTTLRPDAELELWDPCAGKQVLQVEFKTRVTPRDIARARPVYQYARWLLVAPEIGPRAREVLNEARINWLEPDGDYRISVGGLHVERLTRPRRKRSASPRERRYVADPFAGAALRVVRWLLIAREQTWTVAEMSSRAGASAGFVSRAFATLERDAYVERTPSGVRLRDFEGLLKAWAAAPWPQDERLERVSLAGNAVQVLDLLRTRGGTGYAATAEAAADLVAPYARFSRVEIYIEDRSRWDAELELQPVDRGGNLVLIVPVDQGVFAGKRSVSGVTIVSFPQLYVDLFRRGGAAKQAAEFLLASTGNETGSSSR